MDQQITTSLAPLDSTDIGIVRMWRNDHRIWRWCRQFDLISDAEQVRWFNRQSEDPTVRMYKLLLTTSEGSAPVGVAGLTSIDHVNRRAEFSLYVAPQFQGKGFGETFLSLLFDHGFRNLGLNVIWGETFAENPASRLFERLGMMREGTRREFYWRDGRFIDAHLYSLTAGDWNGRKLAARGDAADARALGGAEPGASESLAIPLKPRRGRKPKTSPAALPPEPQGPGAA